MTTSAPSIQDQADAAAQRADDAFRTFIQNPNSNTKRQATRLARVADALGADADRAAWKDSQ